MEARSLRFRIGYHVPCRWRCCSLNDERSRLLMLDRSRGLGLAGVCASLLTPYRYLYLHSRQDSQRGISASNPKAGQLTAKLKEHNNLVDRAKPLPGQQDSLAVSRL